jgi:hypothetical protein
MGPDTIPTTLSCELLFNCVPAANALDSTWPGAEPQPAQFFDQAARWGITTVQDVANDLFLNLFITDTILQSVCWTLWKIAMSWWSAAGWTFVQERRKWGGQ